MDPTRNLRIALGALDAYGSPARVLAGLRSGGRPSVERHLKSVPDREAELTLFATELAARGYDACIVGDEIYPPHLASIKRAPGVLFSWGNLALLKSASIGMCGSRHASDTGLRAAATCGEEVAEHGLTIVSGYAKGVDTETHLAALRSGGTTVIVLAEGITHFRTKRVFAETGLPEDRVLALSQFPPHQRWSIGAAMTRNSVIAGLSAALVVIEAGESGGTLNAGLQALDMGRPVIALEFLTSETPLGNKALFEKGATRVITRQDLGRALERLKPPGASLQLGMI